MILQAKMRFFPYAFWDYAKKMPKWKNLGFSIIFQERSVADLRFFFYALMRRIVIHVFISNIWVMIVPMFFDRFWCLLSMEDEKRERNFDVRAERVCYNED